MAMVWTYVITVLYFPVLGLIKSSILLFLLRLGGQKRALRHVIHGFNIFNIAGTIAITLTAINQCRPIRYFWDPTAQGSCINQPVFYLSQSGLNILTDLITFAVPVFIFVRLRMARRTRIATLYVFFLGFMSVPLLPLSLSQATNPPQRHHRRNRPLRNNVPPLLHGHLRHQALHHVLLPLRH